MSNLQVFRYNNQDISFVDEYVNLNQMANATGKNINQWLDDKSTQELLKKFQTRNFGKYPLIVKKGIESVEIINGCVTIYEIDVFWAHKHIAIQFAYWCGTDFALWF